MERQDLRLPSPHVQTEASKSSRQISRDLEEKSRGPHGSDTLGAQAGEGGSLEKKRESETNVDHPGIRNNCKALQRSAFLAGLELLTASNGRGPRICPAYFLTLGPCGVEVLIGSAREIAQAERTLTLGISVTPMEACCTGYCSLMNFGRGQH